MRPQITYILLTTCVSKLNLVIFFFDFFPLPTLFSFSYLCRLFFTTLNFMKMSICKIYNSSNNALPAYESQLAAGMDLRANLAESVTLNPGERKLIPTGLFVELPEDCEAQIRPRSGLAMKHGITVLNSPGTIDPDYRGEIKVLLVNLSNEPFEIQHGERIAQMVVAKFQQVTLVEVASADELSDTQRGTGGFGHSGTK